MAAGSISCCQQLVCAHTSCHKDEASCTKRQKTKKKSPTLICERMLQDQAQNIVHPKRVNRQKPIRESFPFGIILPSNCSPWNLTDIIEKNRIKKWGLFPHSGFFPQWIQFELLIHCQMCNHRLYDNNPLPTVLDDFLWWLTEYVTGLYLAQVGGFLVLYLIKEHSETGIFKPMWHNILNNLEG